MLYLLNWTGHLIVVLTSLIIFRGIEKFAECAGANFQFIMANFQHPFQCLRYVKRQAEGQQDLLVATAGRNLYSYAASSGQRLDVWPQDVETNAETAPGDVSTTDGQAPPEKKRKLSPAPEQQGDEKSGQKKNAGSKPPVWSSIPILVVSHDSKYIVAVTGEDKCIRVFDLGEDGKFQQLSSR